MAWKSDALLLLLALEKLKEGWRKVGLVNGYQCRGPNPDVERKR